MTLTSEDLQSIASLLDTKLKPIEDRLTAIEATVTKNYGLTEEFYVSQKENNADMVDRLGVIEGELDMHTNQIARNTSDIRRYK